MTPAEINRKISEARSSENPTGHHWISSEWSNSLGRNVGVVPRDWTGSAEANEVLLEEMRPATYWFGEVWIIVTVAIYLSRPVGDTRFAGAEGIKLAEHPDRKTAVCLAWLAWKGIV